MGSHFGNSMSGTLHGALFQGRDVYGDVHINSDTITPSELSVAFPEHLVQHRVRGRDPLIAELRTVTGCVVLCGGGGCGKSTVAHAVAAADARTVWWVDASSREQMVTGLAEVAAQAGVPREMLRSPGAAVKDLLWQALAELDGWLLVVDNADEPGLLDGWVRTPRTGTVLVTSRDQRRNSWPRAWTLREVLPISVDDGGAVLCQIAPDARSADDSTDDSRVLAERLGGLPLALFLAGSYLAQTSTAVLLPQSTTPHTFAQYTAALNREFSNTVRRTASADVLARVWERSVALLEAQGVVRGRSLLHLLATFAPAPIPVRLLRPDVICAEQELEAAMNGLIAFGLVRTERTPDTLVLHSFIRELVVPQADRWVPVRDKLLFEVTKTTNLVDWASWELLLPHCELLAERGAEVTTNSASDATGALFWAGRHAEEAASWAVAERMHSVALEVVRRHLPHERDTIAILRQRLAKVWQATGRLDEAERTLRELRADFTNANTFLTTWHNHAMALLEQGQFVRAHAEFTEVLPLLITIFGERGENVLVARHERARAAFAIGNLVDAAEELKDVVDIAGAEQGVGSPVAVKAKHELAVVLLRAGEAAQALRMFTEVADAEARIFGPEHPDRLITLFSVAQAHMAQGEDVEADLRALLRTWSRVDSTNPSAISVREVLGNLALARGDLARAVAEMYQVVTDSVARLGLAHPDTVNRVEVRGLVLIRGGWLSEAAAEMHSFANALGWAPERVSAVGRIRQVLATQLTKYGQPDAGIVQYQLALALQKKILGPDHPDTLGSLVGIWTAYFARGAVEESREGLIALLPRLIRVLGPGDEQTLAARLTLVGGHIALGDRAAAAAELAEVAAHAEGTQNPDVSAAVNSWQHELK
ncbi:tetratricopeptide repeat protein [Umezawaea sp. Da 62-37]|uniref:tetratricopeptide repeat protein n=1 Tax=Umezawaea sp. Da 62-37 TaxID=3075927 RepID=UPI0028F7102A|nr:tetratricopeptide repeat protein [Umezawaea sp. Da 62-37]WNV87647.1 tetratricopeptide repeat protein [Umezawaea sp. Da 62-37]